MSLLGDSISCDCERLELLRPQNGAQTTASRIDPAMYAGLRWRMLV